MLIDDKLLDEIALKAAESPRLRTNFDLRDSETEGTQRFLNVMEVGTVLPVHRHHDSSEVVCLIRGRLDSVWYDDEGREVARHALCPQEGRYAVKIPAEVWHTLEVIEPSVILECKSGDWHPIPDEDVMDRDLILRRKIEELAEMEARGCSMEPALMSLEYVFRLWGGRVPLERIAAALRD